VDSNWDKKVWEDSRQAKEKEKAHLNSLVEQDLLGGELSKGGEKRREDNGRKGGHKRRRPDNEAGESWGEKAMEQNDDRTNFLYEQPSHQHLGSRQQIIKPLVGAEWVVRGWLYEAANKAVSRSIREERRWEECLSDQLGGDEDDWEEWQSDADRKNQEELFNILYEIDRNCHDCMRDM
jgi:hypothetical protein